MDPHRGRSLLAADLHQQHRLGHRIGFVFAELRVHLQLVADVLGGPVALLAGFAGRAQAVHRARNRRRVEIQCHRHHLPGPGDLGEVSF